MNRVSPIFSSSTQIDFRTQTLNTLNLFKNQIGAKGAKCLSDAIQVNRVSRIFSSSTQIDFRTQTLNTLDLEVNEIGAEGAKCLSDAIQVNRVSPIFSSSTHKSTFEHRHSTHSISEGMKSELKEQNACVMQYK